MKTNRDGLRIINRYDDEYWTEDVDDAEEAVNKLVTRDLTGNQFSAIVSLVVNIGIAEFKRSKLLKILNGASLLDAAATTSTRLQVDRMTLSWIDG